MKNMRSNELHVRLHRCLDTTAVHLLRRLLLSLEREGPAYPDTGIYLQYRYAVLVLLPVLQYYYRYSRTTTGVTRRHPQDAGPYNIFLLPSGTCTLEFFPH